MAQPSSYISRLLAIFYPFVYNIIGAEKNNSDISLVFGKGDNMNKRIPDFSTLSEELFDSSPYAKRPPSKLRTVAIVNDILHICFPLYFPPTESGSLCLTELYLRLEYQIKAALDFSGREDVDASLESEGIIKSIPRIKELLMKDVSAIYGGDPAAVCPEEVMLSYPGFFAIAVYRIAHEFYERKIPLIPRIITEYAHEKTGIDIHAGAKIGEYFFIDHGTGIVIGETTTIGDRVKIYQGVTLGAKSFELDENGNPVKGIKRHPDIGNDVIIYANATILGGNTKIGDGCVIGGNVWLTHSVLAGEKVYYGKNVQ